MGFLGKAGVKDFVSYSGKELKELDHGQEVVKVHARLMDDSLLAKSKQKLNDVGVDVALVPVEDDIGVREHLSRTLQSKLVVVEVSAIQLLQDLYVVVKNQVNLRLIQVLKSERLEAA